MSQNSIIFWTILCWGVLLKRKAKSQRLTEDYAMKTYGGMDE
jgi:hypothetical protein